MAAAGHQFIARSMLHFEHVAFELPRKGDWVFAYSRHGVEGFLAQGRTLEWLGGGDRRLAAIGAKTAEAWTAAGLECGFVGTGEPASTAEAFRAIASGSEVVFVEAEQSRGSVQALLGPTVSALALTTYRATAAEIDLPPVDIALLTSPRSAELFLARVDEPARVQLFCIGPTTAAAVGALGFGVAGVAPRPEVDALLQMIR